MTTRLDVLNHMLNVVGEAPVSSASSNHPTALSAVVTLERVDLEMQSRGWWFNTEYNLNLSPNESDHIIIPQGTLYIDSIDPHSKLIQRGTRLYDPLNHTYAIAHDVVVDCVLQLPISDLPESAAAYLKHKAAYDFYVNDDGDETKASRLEKEVDRAWQKLQQDELKAADVNARNRPITALLRLRMQQGNTRDRPDLPGGG